MKSAYSIKRSVTALLMAFVLMFSILLDIASYSIESAKDTEYIISNEKGENIQQQYSTLTTEKQNTSSYKNDSMPSMPLISVSPTVSATETVEPVITNKNESIVSENLQTDNDSSDIKNNTSSDFFDNDTNLPEIEVAPDNDTILPVENILANAENNTTENYNHTENDTVNVIPATVNNTILDFLPSLITKNIYTFSVSERGAIIYAFNHIDVEKKDVMWYITLYEEFSPDGSGRTIDYRILNSISYTSLGTGISSASIGILPGNYRIEIECISGYTNEKYNLAIGFAETAFYETEPNNSVSRYTELSTGTTINGAASVYKSNTSDTDYYMFKITDTGYSVLYFDHEASADSSTSIAWKVSIVDINGNEYYNTSSTAEKTSFNSGIMGLPPGYYFIIIDSHVYSNVAYSLNLSFTKDDSIEAEFNENAETATPIEINTEKIGSLTYREKTADKDFYSFIMDGDGFISVDFIHSELTEDHDGWNVSILNEKGTTIYKSTSNWNQAILETPNIGLPEGKYYIKIDSDDLYHNNMIYRLVVRIVQNNGWETEPNNTPNDADIITLENPISGTMIENGVNYDTDWFKFNAESDMTLNITFSHIKTDEVGKEGWAISVIDKSGNILTSMTSDWNEDEKSIKINVKAGEYFIIVDTGLYFNSNRYMLLCSNE